MAQGCGPATPPRPLAVSGYRLSPSVLARMRKIKDVNGWSHNTIVNAGILAFEQLLDSDRLALVKAVRAMKKGKAQKE